MVLFYRGRREHSYSHIRLENHPGRCVCWGRGSFWCRATKASIACLTNRRRAGEQRCGCHSSALVQARMFSGPPCPDRSAVQPAISTSVSAICAQCARTWMQCRHTAAVTPRGTAQHHGRDFLSPAARCLAGHPPAEKGVWWEKRQRRAVGSALTYLLGTHLLSNSARTTATLSVRPSFESWRSGRRTTRP